MSSASVSQLAVFVGVNRHSDVYDYRDGWVAFGAGSVVALWAPGLAGIGVQTTLNRHAKAVVAVRFVPGHNVLVSGSEDGLICVWTHDLLSESAAEYVLTGYQETDGAITAIAVGDDGVVVSASSAGTVSVWQLDGPLIALRVVFSVQKNFLPTTLALQTIKQSLLLAVGGTSCDVFVYALVRDDLASMPLLCATLPGHEDWIKCFAFVCEKTGRDYILASGSQDRYIRLWRLRLNDAIASEDDERPLQLLSNKQHKFTLSEGAAAFSFDALIMGHDDWVTGLKWHPSTAGIGSRKLQLLSLSADTALIIWEMDPDSGVWVSISRLGELSIKGASTATGASGGFWSCLWFSDRNTNEQCILASGKTGAIRAYRSRDAENRVWDASLGVTGPIRDVTDVVWSPDGSFLYATSLDQTTRLFARWTKNRPATSPLSSWHEFARPQIHGYDMMCLDNLSATRFVSAGEEKILRVFAMTHSVQKLLCTFSDFTATDTALPEAASLPVLSLSNKAANDQLEVGEAQQRKENYENNVGADASRADPLLDLAGPPLEDHLQRLLLFPEMDKLYGHGYEIICCATTPSGSLIASACRSNSAKHAVIRVFNARNNYLLVDLPLAGHSLTITSMEFSPDGQYLLAVSRDRLFSLWHVRDENAGSFDLVELNQKAHARIIWDASWLPGPRTQFLTCSRDKSIKLWDVHGGSVSLWAVLKTASSVTSISAYPHAVDGSIVAIGNEDGGIALYRVEDGAEEPISEVLTFPPTVLPAARISKLAFSGKTVDGKMQLAVGSMDASVRIFSVSLL